MSKARFPWKDKVSNSLQVGGIEVSAVENGPGRGVRVAWFNTGCGLRYKVVIDRALDIVDAFFNEFSLAWLSHNSLTASGPNVNSGMEWLYCFQGGLLTTCGLSHIGGPEEGRGMHGRISNIPAEIESVIQPDLRKGKLDMSITGVMRESKVFGPSMELRRTISSRIGEPWIKIHDVVTNVGNERSAHMLLYHCNFGWPLADEGAEFLWNGQCVSRGLAMDDAIFDSDHDYKKVPAPLASHNGLGEACGFVDVEAGRNGDCVVGLCNRNLSLAATIKYNKKQLPALANWQHWGKGEFVTGLEPGTNPPIGQLQAKKQKSLVYLGPGKSREYDLEISVVSGKKAIGELRKKY